MHDLAGQLRELRCPSQQLARFAGVADEDGRVAEARAHISVGTDCPVTFSLAFTTSETEKPWPLPRLNESLGLPAASQSMAATCASARSLTCT